MTRRKKTLEHFPITLLYLLNRKETAEPLLKLNYKNKLMKDFHKSLLPLQETPINTKIEVKLRLLKSYSKFK